MPLPNTWEWHLFMLTKIQILIFLLIVGVSQIAPDALESYQNAICLLLILFIGIPHGAADHQIFKRLQIQYFGATRLWSFIGIYILIGISFTILWLIGPFRATLIFVCVSIYHFGQEHFSDLTRGKHLKTVAQATWGTFVLLFPLCYHLEDTFYFINQILGSDFKAPAIFSTSLICGSLLLVTLCAVGFLMRSRIISRKRFKWEVSQILMLAVIFASTPLTVGFTLYFIFWHSLRAIEDQMHFFKRFQRNYRLRNYVNDVAFFSIVAIIFITVLLSQLNWSEGEVEVAYTFMLLGFITLPHILIFDIFYAQRRVSQRTAKRGKMKEMGS